MMAPIFRANSALASASAGRGLPRSANTLPRPTTYSFLAIALTPLPAHLHCQLEASLDEIDLHARRRDAALRLLLKGVQHEHSLAQAHRVHGSERIAPKVRHNLQHVWAQALERLRGHVLLTSLRQVQGIPDFIL